jgi:hypothetical protein
MNRPTALIGKVVHFRCAKCAFIRVPRSLFMTSWMSGVFVYGVFLKCASCSRNRSDIPAAAIDRMHITLARYVDCYRIPIVAVFN